jgi:hypothetical protein
MEKKIGFIIVIAVLAAFLVKAHIELGALEDELYRISDEATIFRSQASRQIASLHDEIDRLTEETTRLLPRHSYTVGRFDPKTLLVPVTYTLHPSVLTPDTTVTVQLGIEDYPVERKGDSFVVTVPFSLFDTAIPSVRIYDKNSINIMGLYRPWEVNPRYVLPQINACFFIEKINVAATGQLRGEIYSDTSPSENGISFIDTRLLISVDGQMILEKALSEKEEYDTYQIDEFLSLPKSWDWITLTLVAKDTNGWEHHYDIYKLPYMDEDAWQQSGPPWSDYYVFESARIYDSSGELLWERDYI